MPDYPNTCTSKTEEAKRSILLALSISNAAADRSSPLVILSGFNVKTNSMYKDFSLLLVAKQT